MKNNLTGTKIVSQNKKASFNYFLSDFLECGIELRGSEIKSVREGGCSIGDSYVIFKNGEALILNMNIAPYEKASVFNHEALRTRRLLLHKKEIRKFEEAVKIERYTVVPTKVYFRKGMCKIEIALGKGKNRVDKRETIKNRDIQRNLKKGNNADA